MYIRVYQIIKNQGLGPYNSLRHADNRKYFSGLSLTQNRGAHMFYLAREVKFGDVLAERKVILSWLMNSSMVKPEKFDHLQLVYHFTVALKVTSATKVFFALNEFFYLWGKKCFALEISRQNLWRHHRHCKIMEFKRMLIYFESQLLSKWKLVKYQCAVWKTFLKCALLNVVDVKLVPGPFMILLRW